MNQKGGVGKTTTVVNLSAALARRGLKILIVDCDPQANASTHLGIDIHAGNPTLYDVLTQGKSMAECIVPVSENLDIVPSELDLAGAEVELVATIGRETLLREALARLHRDGAEYDIVFLDCPPSLGLLPSNALAAATEVIIVLQAEFFALQGISQLSKFIDLVVDRINPGLEVSTVITCMYDSRTRFSREVIDDISEHFSEQMLGTFIRRNVKLAEASSHGVSVFDYDSSCPGARDYSALADEFLARHPEFSSRAVAVPRKPRRRSSRKARAGGGTPEGRTGSPGRTLPQSTVNEPEPETEVAVRVEEQLVAAAVVVTPAGDAIAADAGAAAQVTPGANSSTRAEMSPRTVTRGLVLSTEDELLGL